MKLLCQAVYTDKSFSNSSFQRSGSIVSVSLRGALVWLTYFTTTALLASKAW